MGLVVSADQGSESLRGVFGSTDFAHVRLEGDGDLLWITLQRPERLNAMTDRMLRELQTVYDGIEAGGWRCAVMIGAGRGFCAGADLAQIGSVLDFTDAEQVRQYLDTGWQQLVLRMRDVPVPTVAAVHGPAYGGGANLALAADLVVAAESAVFCQSYIDRGISPDLGGTIVLPRLVGVQHARRQLLLGVPVPADEALRIGMVCDVVPDAELRDTARSVAAALAVKDPVALTVIRRLVDGNAALRLGEGLANESLGVAETLKSPLFRAATDRYRGVSGVPVGTAATEP